MPSQVLAGSLGAVAQVAGGVPRYAMVRLRGAGTWRFHSSGSTRSWSDIPAFAQEPSNFAERILGKSNAAYLLLAASYVCVAATLRADGNTRIIHPKRVLCTGARLPTKGTAEFSNFTLTNSKIVPDSSTNARQSDGAGRFHCQCPRELRCPMPCSGMAGITVPGHA